MLMASYYVFNIEYPVLLKKCIFDAGGHHNGQIFRSQKKGGHKQIFARHQLGTIVNVGQ